MRLLLGMVLGAMLTVLFAYIHDARVASPPADSARASVNAPAVVSGKLVNWDVAGASWHDFTAGVADLGRQAQRGFVRLAGKPQ